MYMSGRKRRLQQGKSKFFSFLATAVGGPGRACDLFADVFGALKCSLNNNVASDTGSVTLNAAGNLCGSIYCLGAAQLLRQL